MRKKFLAILGVQVFIIFLVATLLGSFLLYPTVLDRLQARFKEESRARARIIVASISDRCIEPILDGDDLVLGLIIAKAAKDYGGMKWVGIADTEGETIAHTELKLVGKKITLPLGIVPKTEGDFVSGFYGRDGNMLWAAYPITIGDSRRGTVHIGMSVDPDIVLGEAQVVRRKTILVYAGLGAISALLILLLSYRPIRNLSLLEPKTVTITAAKPEEKEFTERIAKKREEEAEIAERIVKMRNKEKELITRIKTLKKQEEISEKSGEVETAPQFVSDKEKVAPPAQSVSVKEKARSTPQFALEKEKIEAIRKRIQELEQRIHGK